MVQQSEDMRLVFLYRYISLTITSLFYIIDSSNHSIKRKIFVIMCITLSSLILNYLYSKNHKSISKIKLLLLIETLGNSFILIPSGGLSSPYVWYALNTILIASIKLSKKYCWLNLFVYLFSSICFLYSTQERYTVSLIEFFYEEMNLILSFVLITAAIQQLSKYIKRIENNRIQLTEINNKLELANIKIKKSMDYTTELYQAVHLLTSESNEYDLIKLIIKYTQQITQSSNVFFYDLFRENNEVIFVNDTYTSNLKNNIEHMLFLEKKDIVESQIIKEVVIDKSTYIISPVRTNCKVFGILGAETSMYEDDIEREEVAHQLKLLSEIGAIVLEKLQLERVNNRLIINEEQKRIADEIHDSTLQRLFVISCGVTSLMKKVKRASSQSYIDELNTIRDSIDKAMKELRSTVYGLSWKKNGEDNFLLDITSYIDEVKALNNCNIELNIEGNTELLSSQQKKALYRILSEGIGNSVRHGKASNIKLDLEIKKDASSLTVVDNGIGFNLQKTSNHQQNGLGLNNMKYLVHSLRGEILFDSTIGKGTKINITIPNNHFLSREEIV